MLKLESLHKRIGNFELKDINLNIEEGEYFVLLGRSGSGKSLILETIAGLQMPDNGDIKINNKSVLSTSIQKRNIGLVFQKYSLFPHMTVKNNIYFAGKNKIRRNRFLKNIEPLIDILGISHLLDRYPLTLSLGEAQRVSLVRTLVTNPCCILLDEPLASLDAQAKTEIRSLLRRINKGISYCARENHAVLPKTIIHVTHDYEEALALASRIAVIENGVISQTGEPAEIFRHPGSEFIAGFIGIKNFYRGCIKNVDRYTSEFHIYKNNDPSAGLTNICFIIPKIQNCDGDPECIILRSEDIILSNSPLTSSARNMFEGKIIDMEKVRNGIEITVDINNVHVSSLITESSLISLKLELNAKVFISFKASAVRSY